MSISGPQNGSLANFTPCLSGQNEVTSVADPSNNKALGPTTATAAAKNYTDTSLVLHKYAHM